MMSTGQPMFQSGILAGFLRVGNQITPEINVTGDICMPFLKNMDVESVTQLVSFDKEPPPGDSILSLWNISGTLHFFIVGVDLLDITDYHEYVNDRFGVHTWNGGASDMMNFNQFSPENYS